MNTKIILAALVLTASPAMSDVYSPHHPLGRGGCASVNLEAQGRDNDISITSRGCIAIDLRHRGNDAVLNVDGCGYGNETQVTSFGAVRSDIRILGRGGRTDVFVPICPPGMRADAVVYGQPNRIVVPRCR